MPNRGPGPFRTPGSPQAGGWGGAAAASVPAAAAAGGTTATAGDVYNKAPWLFPPSDYINVDIGPTQGVGAGAATGAVAIPAIGVTATILTYACPNGRYGRITALGIDFVLNGSSAGDAFVQGILPAQLTFSIQLDGRPVKNYEQFNYLPGQVSSPGPITGFPIKENQVLTILVTNNSLAVSMQFLAARIQGYLFSKKMHSPITGYQS